MPCIAGKRDGHTGTPCLLIHDYEFDNITTDEVKNILVSRVRLMGAEERAEFVCELYGMDIIDRKKFREMLGISEDEFLKRTMFGTWLTALDEQFDSLSDEFLSAKLMDIMKEYGEYWYGRNGNQGGA